MLGWPPDEIAVPAVRVDLGRIPALLLWHDCIASLFERSGSVLIPLWASKVEHDSPFRTMRRSLPVIMVEVWEGLA